MEDKEFYDKIAVREFESWTSHLGSYKEMNPKCLLPSKGPYSIIYFSKRVTPWEIKNKGYITAISYEELYDGYDMDVDIYNPQNKVKRRNKFINSIVYNYCKGHKWNGREIGIIGVITSFLNYYKIFEVRVPETPVTSDTEDDEDGDYLMITLESD